MEKCRFSAEAECAGVIGLMTCQITESEIAQQEAKRLTQEMNGKTAQVTSDQIKDALDDQAAATMKNGIGEIANGACQGAMEVGASAYERYKVSDNGLAKDKEAANNLEKWQNKLKTASKSDIIVESGETADPVQMRKEADEAKARAATTRKDAAEKDNIADHDEALVEKRKDTVAAYKEKAAQEVISLGEATPETKENIKNAEKAQVEAESKAVTSRDAANKAASDAADAQNDAMNANKKSKEASEGYEKALQTLKDVDIETVDPDREDIAKAIKVAKTVADPTTKKNGFDDLSERVDKALENKEKSIERFQGKVDKDADKIRKFGSINGILGSGLARALSAADQQQQALDEAYKQQAQYAFESGRSTVDSMNKGLDNAHELKQAMSQLTSSLIQSNQV